MTLTQQAAQNVERALGIKIPNQTCPHCHQGQVPLEVHFLQVWNALDPTEPRTAFDIAKLTACSVQTVKYRLMVLASMGLARQAGLRPPPKPKGGRSSPEWVRVEAPKETAP